MVAAHADTVTLLANITGIITVITTTAATLTTVGSLATIFPLAWFRLVTIREWTLFLGHVAQSRCRIFHFDRLLLNHLVDDFTVLTQVFIAKDTGQLFLEVLDADITHVTLSRQTHRLDLLARCVFDSTQHTTLTGCSKQNRSPLTTRSTGTTNTVYVGFGIVRNIVVNNVTDTLNVKTTSSDIGSDQNIERTFLQAVDHLLTQRLAHITIKSGSGEATGFELFCQLNRSRTGTYEDNHGVELFDFQNPGQRIQLVQTARHPHLLGDRGDSGGLGTNLNRDRLFQIGICDTADRWRHGGREQSGLTLRRGMLENPLDIINKAHPQHFVGFVEYDRLQAIKLETATTQVIHHSTWGTNNHLSTTVQTTQLATHILPTVDGQNMKVRDIFGVALAGFSHLNGQLTGRAENQNLCFVRVRINAGQSRQSKCCGLTCTRLGQTEQVPPFQQMGNTTRLDRRRGLITNIAHGTKDGI